MQVDELDLTTRLVYGTSIPGADPNTHIRADVASSRPAPVTYSMFEYLTTGAGRYALPSIAPIIDAFFQDDILPFSTLTDRETPYSLAEVRSLLGVNGEGNDDLEFTVNQYLTDPLSSDYIERAYIFGSTGFTLGTSLAFSVKDGKYTVSGIEVKAFDDNFDFQSDSIIASFANPLLEKAFDPYGLIPTIGANTLPVDIQYRGGGKFYNDYSLSDYILDSASSAAFLVSPNVALVQLTAALVGLGTNTGYLGAINGNNLFSYYTEDGKKVVYGTNGNDTIGVLSAEITPAVYFSYQMVGGKGVDSIKGGAFDDELWGGEGDDLLEGSVGDDRLIGGADVDTALYSGSCLDYNLSKAADGTVTISHVRGAMADGTDTLTGVEKAKFADHEIDLTLPTLVGCTELSFVNDFVVGTTLDTRVVFDLERLGDTTYPITVFVDGQVTTGNAFFNDFFYTFQPGAAPQLVIGASVAEVFGDVAFDFRISLTVMDVLAPFVEITDGTAGGVLIGDQVDDQGGQAWGDPHLISFDNVAFDFQASGEFVLTRATSGPAYEVQAQFVPISSAISVTRAVATKIGDTTVSLEAGGPLRVNGTVTELASGSSIAIGAGSVVRNGSSFEIANGSGDKTVVDVFGTFLNVSPQPSSARARGTLEGLFGNKNGTPADDFSLSDGTVLTTPIPTETLYGAFAASWTVNAADRLLPGNPEPFSAPGRIVTLDSLPAALRAEAEAAVDAAGITNPLIREAAILDFALTGNRDFIDAAVLTDQNFNPIVDTIPVDPVSSPVILLTADKTTLNEEDAANRTATFTISRGEAEGGVTVFYSVSNENGTPASGADFVNGTVTGSVVIPDGEESTTFTVVLANDTVSEGPEVFDVSIAVEPEQADDYEVLISSVRVTVEDDDMQEPVRMTGKQVRGTNEGENLAGGKFDDFLIGRGGDDAMYGGRGADQFRFFGSEIIGTSDRDRIFDLKFDEGDKLVFGSYAAGTFIDAEGENAFSGNTAAILSSWTGVVNADRNSDAISATRQGRGNDNLVLSVENGAAQVQQIVITGGWSQYLAAGGGEFLPV